MERRHVLISGDVHGVFFRASTRDLAREVGATGWVRNLPDGRVEVQAQGEPGVLDRVVAHCRTGPPQAGVTQVEISEVPPVDDEQGFEVR